MPDWSYHILFKPFLSKMSSLTSREFIHRGMNTVASLPGGSHIINFLGREECSPLLKKTKDQIVFSNPIGISGSLDPQLTGTKAFTNLGFGFIEIGPVTVEKREGNATAIDFKKQTIDFLEKFESIGLEATKRKLQNIEFKQPLFIRLKGTSEEKQWMIQELEEFASAFVVEDKDVERLHTKKPIYLAIHIDQASMEGIKEYEGIILEDEYDPQRYVKVISDLRETGYDKTIMTVGAVKEPQDALGIIDAGADFIILSKEYVFSGPGLTKRINEALLNRLSTKNEVIDGWQYYWLFGLMIVIGGILALFISLQSVLLPYDEQFLQTTKDEIWSFNKRILLFMSHDRMTLAGTMISGGIVYMSLARHGVRKGLLWTKQAIDIAAIVGFLGIFSFIGYGYFDWLHLVFWLLLIPFYLLGFIKTKGLTNTPSSTNLRNNKWWKLSLVGQLFFVILGFSFVIGGLVISYIGVTNVFVSTDLLYLCMPPEILDEFNQRLIPVIAHDRAGFGSALLSVGLLVLMLALWGFQQGNRWMWWTLFVGGLPAFFTGIWIHFKIGYTTFIHLLPAYFALFLFVIGLILSYAFLHKGDEG
ncbi:dihydroorotate dehydrogenase [Bacillus carboniphilus]|uniref:Dihydroorotate dehydrogenase n=1 Tax=Bacillus carboniphilus TaxID=86663 RepID=A0ABY9JWW0_9BACI|nr:dihydroorotate dehydrogenase [Bacillus carboniphilus]WLR42110.1 dihydroorotate dehydrogenase [Bacillus carboniphilus]